jgi:AraC-like DNA-binding protein
MLLSGCRRPEWSWSKRTAPRPAARLRIPEADIAAAPGTDAQHRRCRYEICTCPSILGVARAGGLSRRRFSGLFIEQVNFTPKLYRPQASLDGGYSNQSHMAHAFHEFSGVSPGAWLVRERPLLNRASDSDGVMELLRFYVHAGPANTIMHAELTPGGGMVMLALGERQGS